LDFFAKLQKKRMGEVVCGVDADAEFKDYRIVSWKGM
jgi:hypothetical protein